MALYLVSYNLNKPEQDYPELVDYLYLIGARKVLDSEWLVRSGATRDAVYKGVKAHLESGDGLLVCLVQSAVGDNLIPSARGDMKISGHPGAVVNRSDRHLWKIPVKSPGASRCV